MSGADSDKTVVYTPPRTTPLQNSIQIIQGEPYGSIRFFSDTILIGKSPNCDLYVTDDMSVSRQHMRIERIESKFILINMAKHNTIYLERENTPQKKIQNSSQIKSGDIITVGNTHLQFTIGGKKEKPHTKKIKKKVVFGRIKIAIAILALILITAGLLKIYSSKSESKIQQYIDQGIIQYKKQQYRRALAWFRKVFEENPQNKTARKYEKLCENRTVLNNTLKDGKRLFDQDEFHRALELFRQILAIDKQHKEATVYRARCEHAIAKNKRILKQEGEHAKKVVRSYLKSAEILVRYRPANKTLREVKKAFKKLQEAEIVIQKASNVLQEAKELFQNPENRNYPLTKQTVAKFDKLREQTDILDKEITQKKKRYEEKSGVLSIRANQIKKLYDQFQKYYKQHKLYPALKILDKIIRLNVPCKQTALAFKHIDEVKMKLTRQIKSEYDQGQAFYIKGDFISAASYLQKVVEIYPPYQNAQALLKQCETKLETEAKQYYEDGVIYEGIGKINLAIHFWKKVLEVMPVRSNRYYQRASAKLRAAND